MCSSECLAEEYAEINVIYQVLLESLSPVLQLL